MGLIACFMLPMVCHLPVVMQSPLDWVMHPETMLQIFTEHQCTLAWLPNFAFQFVPRRTPSERWSRYDLSSARALINCSEPVRASSMNEFYEAFAPMRTEAIGAADRRTPWRKTFSPLRSQASMARWRPADNLGSTVSASAANTSSRRWPRMPRRGHSVHIVGTIAARQ